MNIAVILAGGSGSRLGYSTPKQFFKIAGKTVIEHTINVFERNVHIDEIAVVVNDPYQHIVEDMVLTNSWRKVKKVLMGGQERYHSSLAAITAYQDRPDDNLIFHDAVRPLVDDRIINDVVAAMDTYNAVDVAVPATDTIIQVDADHSHIQNIPNRSFLQRGQTPQAFKVHTITQAYNLALKDPTFVSTDDCGVVAKYLPQEKIYVVKGEESNMKLTYKEDLFLLDKLFQLRSTQLHTQVDFTHLKDKTLVVFGGNSGIGEQVMKIAEANGARVFSFSRSTTQTDIASRQAVRQALAGVAEKTWRIDYVVNAAALLVRQPLATMDDTLIDQMTRTNFNGMVNVAVESYPYLKASQGQLLLYTSSSYTRGRAFYSIYSSLKAAVVNFMQALSQEWDADGVRVNVINPERTKTPMRLRNFGNEPERTLLSPEDVAEVSLQTLLLPISGQVVDVKIKKE